MVENVLLPSEHRIPKYALGSFEQRRSDALGILFKHRHERFFTMYSGDLESELRIVLERFDSVRYDGVFGMSHVCVVQADSVLRLKQVQPVGYFRYRSLSVFFETFHSGGIFEKLDCLSVLLFPEL